MNKLTIAAVAALSGIALVGIVVLAVLGVPVPELLGLVVTTGLGGLVGAVLPRPSAGPTDQTGPFDPSHPEEYPAPAAVQAAA